MLRVSLQWHSKSADLFQFQNAGKNKAFQLFDVIALRRPLNRLRWKLRSKFIHDSVLTAWVEVASSLVACCEFASSSARGRESRLGTCSAFHLTVPNDWFGRMKPEQTSKTKHSLWASNEGERAFEGLTRSVESPTSESWGTSPIGDVPIHTRAVSLKRWFGHCR